MSIEEKYAILNRKFITLQRIYAAALTDATFNYGKEGVIENVTKRKRAIQMMNGANSAKQFGIESPEKVFKTLGDIFGCAKWEIEKSESDNEFTAVTKGCMLCGLTKKVGAPKPCELFCLDPMEGMIKGIDSDAEYTVEKTLWDSDSCRVRVRSKKIN